MAITISQLPNVEQSVSLGPVKRQIVSYRALTGATSGTITASALSRMYHILLLGSGSILHTAAPTYATNVATLAFTVKAETAASLIVQDLTYTAVADLGASGNSITIAYTAGATAGAEVVTVTASAISIQIETAVSTATQVRTAFNASAAAIALASCAVTGTGSTAQVVATATALAGGVNGGARGYAMCVGI